MLAFPDMHGRPVGKRVTADFFTSHAAEHGMEACDYLLGVDVDMNPLPGYRFTNWDKGYGDFVARPDYSTARLIPWLEGTAFVICDLTDEDGVPVEVSPRRILRRQLERAAERGLRVCSATELEFFLFKESYEEADAKGWQGLTPHTSTIEDYQLLQTSREEYVLRRIRNEMMRRRHPDRDLQGRSGARSARGERRVGRGTRHGRPSSRLQERRQGDRSAGGPRRDLHGEVDDGRSGLVVPRAHEPVGHRKRRPVDGARRRDDGASHPSGLSKVGRHFLAGQLHAARELAWMAAPTVNSYRRYVPGSWAPTAAGGGSRDKGG